MTHSPTDFDDADVSFNENVLHQIIEQQDEGWKELPDDAAFAALAAPAPQKPKRLARIKKSIKRRITRIFSRKRSYAYRIA